MNERTNLKASVLITWSGVLKALEMKAAKKYAKTKNDEDKTPLIATRDNAKDWANRHNVACLVSIGNKERLIERVRATKFGESSQILFSRQPT